MQRSIPGVRIHPGVGIEHGQAFGWPGRPQRIQVSGAVHAFELFRRGAGCLMMLQQRVQAGRNQLVFDGRDARRAFWMPLPHFVQQAGGMADVGGRHGG